MRELAGEMSENEGIYWGLIDYCSHPDIQWAIIAEELLSQAEIASHDLSGQSERDRANELRLWAAEAKARSNYLWWPDEKDQAITPVEPPTPLARLGGIAVTTTFEGASRFMYQDRTIDKASVVGNTPNITFVEVTQIDGGEEKVFQKRDPNKGTYQKLLETEVNNGRRNSIRPNNSKNKARLGHRIMRNHSSVRPSNILQVA